MRHPSDLGQSLCTILDELRLIQSADVVLPTTEQFVSHKQEMSSGVPLRKGMVAIHLAGLYLPSSMRTSFSHSAS